MPSSLDTYSGDLAEWIEVPTDTVVHYAEVLNSWTKSRSDQTHKWLPTKADASGASSDDVFTLLGPRALGRRAGTLPAFARFQSIAGRKAHCAVQIAGTELPVELPAHVLTSHGLKPGSRFLWWMSQDGSVALEDIDDLPANCLTNAEIEEAKTLYQNLCDDIAAGDTWGLST